MGGLRRHPAGSMEADLPASSNLPPTSSAPHPQPPPQPPPPPQPNNKAERPASFLPATSSHAVPPARPARNDSLTRPAATAAASPPMRGRRQLSHVEAADRPSPYVQTMAAKTRRSRRAQRIPSIAAHLIAAQTQSTSQRASVPALFSNTASAVSAQPSHSQSALPVSLPPLLQRSQTVVSPKHSSRRVEAARQANEAERRERELERAVGSRNGRRCESVLVGGRLAELSKRRAEDGSIIDAPPLAERVVSEPQPLHTPRVTDSQARHQQAKVEQRSKAVEEQKEELPPPAHLEPLISQSTTASAAIASSHVHADSHVLGPTPQASVSHGRRPSLASFASSPLTTLSQPRDHTQAVLSARLAACTARPSHPSDPPSASATPSRRPNRRQLRAAESSVRDAAELAAEGDIDGWVDWAGGWMGLERGGGEEETRRRREGDRLGRLEVAVCDDANRQHRQSMEDAHTVFLAFSPPESPPEHPASSFFAVYDGHGGAFASTYAKRHLHRLFAKHLQLLQQQHSLPLTDPANDSDSDAVQAAFEAAFSELSDVMARSKRFVSCGTTAVCCYIQQLPHATAIHCANLGDAQAFLFAQPPAPPHPAGRLTTVHTAHNPIECARIVAAGGHILLNRVNGVLAVTRALGDSGMGRAGLVAVPAYRRVEVAAGSGGWLVLCCDGVSDVLSEDELQALVTKASAGGGDVSAASMANKVVSDSLSHHSTDNITACVVRIHAS